MEERSALLVTPYTSEFNTRGECSDGFTKSEINSSDVQRVVLYILAVVVGALTISSLIMLSDRAPDDAQIELYKAIKDTAVPLMSFLALMVLFLSYIPYLILKRQPDIEEVGLEKLLLYRTRGINMNAKILANSLNTYILSRILWFPFCISIYCYNLFCDSHMISMLEIYLIALAVALIVTGRKVIAIMLATVLFEPTHTCMQLWLSLYHYKKAQISTIDEFA